MDFSTTICAISTPPGLGGVAMIRVSGSDAINLTQSLLHPGHIPLSTLSARRVHHVSLMDGDSLLDHVLLTIFLAPRSFTGEDVVEISCHGSEYIQRRILELLIRNGVRMAEPGEFSMRAFMHRKMDLSQTEALADLLQANSAAAHKVAISQLRGGYADELKRLRAQLLELTSLMELELDFSEEDVVFADRDSLLAMIESIHPRVKGLIDSFQQGRVMRQGIPVAIIGAPNVGKSTLLNTLVKDERSIVSDVAGTTRDTVEDQLIVGGQLFRVIDTAGIRHNAETIEALGIERSYQTMDRASIIFYLCDARGFTAEAMNKELSELSTKVNLQQKKLLILVSKSDLQAVTIPDGFPYSIMTISAKTHQGIAGVLDFLSAYAMQGDSSAHAVMSNLRHYEAMMQVDKAIERVKVGISTGLSSDLIAIDLHEALHYIGEITGEVSTEEILGEIFGRFCIGK